jgi:NitT/TauT family transport system permease protein
MGNSAVETVKIRQFRVTGVLWQPLQSNWIEALALISGALLWEALGWLLSLPWLPPFSQVIASLIQFIQTGVILANLAVSLQGLAIGFSFSLVVGLFVGALMGRYRLVEEALDIYVYTLFISPSMIFAPIFFALFGLSDAVRIAVIIVYSVFVIIINTATAIRTVDPGLVEMARSFGCNERQIFLRILLPASLPLVFAGIRLGMGRAVKGMINGEMFIALVGLGALAQRYGSQFESSKVFALAMVVLIVALAGNWIVQIFENRLTSWVE